MTAIPLADAPRLAGAARRTAVVRSVLGLVVVGSLLAALAFARHPHTHALVPLTGTGDTIVVVDLSASISTDTYSQIGATLGSLAHSNGRLGLIFFSDQAYVALPQGTPAADLAPLIPLFTLPKQMQSGFAPTLPRNPWTAAFSGGTKISAGLTLAHTLATSAKGLPAKVDPDQRPERRPPRPVSDSPRSCSPTDATRYPVRIVGLDPAAADVALFRRALSPAPAVDARPGRRSVGAGTRTRHSRGRSSSARSRPVRQSRCSLGVVAATRVGTRVTKRLVAALQPCSRSPSLVLLLAADVRSWRTAIAVATRSTPRRPTTGRGSRARTSAAFAASLLDTGDDVTARRACGCTGSRRRRTCDSTTRRRCRRREPPHRTR